MEHLRITLIALAVTIAAMCVAMASFLYVFAAGGDSPRLAGDAVSICEVLESTGVNVFIGVLSSSWAPERSASMGPSR